MNFTGDDRIFYEIVLLYRSQRAFAGARLNMNLWRLHRQLRGER